MRESGKELVLVVSKLLLMNSAYKLSNLEREQLLRERRNYYVHLLDSHLFNSGGWVQSALNKCVASSGRSQRINMEVRENSLLSPSLAGGIAGILIR